MIIAALVVSIVAAAGSVGAVWYARRSARSSATSAAAAETTAVHDSQRRHAELTPQFEIICTVGNNGVGGHGELRLALAGPAGLNRLDEVTVAILDEVGTDHWARGFPAGGDRGRRTPVRLGAVAVQAGASAQVTDNRTTRPRALLPVRRQELGPPQPGAHAARSLDEHEARNSGRSSARD